MLHVRNRLAEHTPGGSGGFLPARPLGRDIRRPTGGLDRADGRTNAASTRRVRNAGEKVGPATGGPYRTRGMVLQPPHQRGLAGTEPSRERPGAHQRSPIGTALPIHDTRAAESTGYHPLSRPERVRPELRRPDRTAE